MPDGGEWTQPVNEVQMNDWIEPLDQGQQPGGSVDTVSSSQTSQSTRQSSTASASPVALPEETQLITLVDLFFAKFYHFLPILHKPTVMSRVSSTARDRSPLLLFSIIAITAKAHSDRAFQSLQTIWFEEAKRLFFEAVRTAEHPLQTLQAANLLMFQCIATAEYHTGWMILGEAWQKAVATGCNVLDGPPQLTLRGLGSIPCKSWPDAEECRRSVWMFFMFDRSMCFPIGLNHAIDDRKLRLNLPMSDEAFQCLDAPQDETSVAYRPNLDRLIASLESHNQKGRANPLEYIVLGYIFLGHVTDRIFSIDDDDQEPALDKLASQLGSMRLTLPASVSSFSTVEPEDFSYVIWINSVWNSSAALLHHRSLQPDETLDKESTMAACWPKCVASARNTVSLIREAAQVSTDYIINPHLAGLLFVCTRILIMEYACPFESRISNRDALYGDIQTLLRTFLRMKDAFEAVGRKFRNGLIFYLQSREEFLLEAKAGGSRDLLKTCNSWPDYPDEEFDLGD